MVAGEGGGGERGEEEEREGEARQMVTYNSTQLGDSLVSPFLQESQPSLFLLHYLLTTCEQWRNGVK